MADQRGAPPRSKFFQFHAGFGKFWQNHMLAPPLLGSWRLLSGEILDPPLLRFIRINSLNGYRVAMYSVVPFEYHLCHWSRISWQLGVSTQLSCRTFKRWWCPCYQYMSEFVVCKNKIEKVWVYLYRLCHSHWRTQGGTRDVSPPPFQILSFSCS